MKTIFTESERAVLRESASPDHSTHPTVVEYAVRFLFKRKGPAAAAKATVKKLNGYTNYFIDTRPTSINAKTLEDAIWDRLLNKVQKNIATFKPGSESYALGAVVDYFKLGKADAAKLKKLVKSRLGVTVP